MSEAPKEIWVTKSLALMNRCPIGDCSNDVKYLRADLHEAEIAKKDKEIALWKKSFRAADKDNIELREENAALIADIEELKRFVRDITLELQDHLKKTPAQMDMLFQKAYTLYVKYDVENRQAINKASK